MHRLQQTDRGATPGAPGCRSPGRQTRHCAGQRRPPQHPHPRHPEWRGRNRAGLPSDCTARRPPGGKSGDGGEGEGSHTANTKRVNTRDKFRATDAAAAKDKKTTGTQTHLGIVTAASGKGLGWWWCHRPRRGIRGAKGAGSIAGSEKNPS